MKTTALRVDIERQLPCGHTMAHRVVKRDVPEGELAVTACYAIDVIEYWFKKRASQHDCKLVSETNPLGLPPKCQ